MTAHRGDVGLLADPVAQELLSSREVAHLAYVWPDGTPRVVPIGFHWDGSRMVFGTPPGAPKLRALRQNPRVSITVDSSSWQYHVLLLRGDVEIEDLDDVSPEYAAASRRYLGDDAGDAWVGQLRGKPMARISLKPAWTGILDCETRFPSALVLRRTRASAPPRRGSISWTDARVLVVAGAHVMGPAGRLVARPARRADVRLHDHLTAARAPHSRPEHRPRSHRAGPVLDATRLDAAGEPPVSEAQQPADTRP